MDLFGTLRIMQHLTICKLKAFADNYFSVAKWYIFSFYRVKTLWEKEKMLVTFKAPMVYFFKVPIPGLLKVCIVQKTSIVKKCSVKAHSVYCLNAVLTLYSTDTHFDASTTDSF